jgi:hypothetical protein
MATIKSPLFIFYFVEHLPNAESENEKASSENQSE